MDYEDAIMKTALATYPEGDGFEYGNAERMGRGDGGELSGCDEDPESGDDTDDTALEDVGPWRSTVPVCLLEIAASTESVDPKIALVTRMMERHYEADT